MRTENCCQIMALEAWLSCWLRLQSRSAVAQQPLPRSKRHDVLHRAGPRCATRSARDNCHFAVNMIGEGTKRGQAMMTRSGVNACGSPPPHHGAWQSLGGSVVNAACRVARAVCSSLARAARSTARRPASWLSCPQRSSSAAPRPERSLPTGDEHPSPRPPALLAFIGNRGKVCTTSFSCISLREPSCGCSALPLPRMLFTKSWQVQG